MFALQLNVLLRISKEFFSPFRALSIKFISSRAQKVHLCTIFEVARIVISVLFCNLFVTNGAANIAEQELDVPSRLSKHCLPFSSIKYKVHHISCSKGLFMHHFSSARIVIWVLFWLLFVTKWRCKFVCTTPRCSIKVIQALR